MDQDTPNYSYWPSIGLAATWWAWMIWGFQLPSIVLYLFIWCLILFGTTIFWLKPSINRLPPNSISMGSPDSKMEAFFYTCCTCVVLPIELLAELVHHMKSRFAH